jgi:hypothetical protein
MKTSKTTTKNKGFPSRNLRFEFENTNQLKKPRKTGFSVKFVDFIGSP